MAIEIEMTADVRNVIKALNAGEVSLAEITDKLDEASGAGSDAGRTIASSTEDATRSLEETTDAGDKLGSALGDVGGIAKDALEGDLAGAAGKALGSVAALAGGAGAIAGTAVAAVSGIVEGIADAVDENAKAAEERIKTMYESFIDSGLDYLTQEQALKALSAITGDPDKNAALLQQAKDLGIGIDTILAAQIQRGEDRNAVQARLIDLIAESNQKLEDGTYTDGTRLTTLEGYLNTYKQLNGEQDQSIQGAELYRAGYQAITGEAMKTTEELQKWNKLLAEQPVITPTVDLEPAKRELKKLTDGSYQVNIDGKIRVGQKVV